MSWITNLFVGSDGKPDEIATLTIIGVFVFLALTIFDVVIRHHAFDQQSFGIGLAAAVGGAATGMGGRTYFERRNSYSQNDEELPRPPHGGM